MISRLAALLVLTGCTPMAEPTPLNPPVPPAAPEEARCDRDAVQPLIGRPASEELGAEALRLSGAARLRWKRPGDMVTMDYRPDRLTVELDENGRVTGFGCG